MDSTQILSIIEDALEQDEQLNTWCQTELGKLPFIMSGYDPIKPPGAGHYPLIILFDIVSDKEALRETHITRQVAVSCGVENRNITKTGRRIKYDGMIQAESFREQISRAILKKFLGKIEIRPLGTESVYPLFASGMNISIKSSYTI